MVNYQTEIAVNYPGIKEWNIQKTKNFNSKLNLSKTRKFLSEHNVKEFQGNRLNIEIQTKPIFKDIWLSGPGLNLGNLNPSREWIKAIFDNQTKKMCCDFSNVDYILENYHIIHLRLGDIWDENILKRSDYFPLPLSFYREVEGRSMRPFAFLAENINESTLKYINPLLKMFKNSILLPSKCVHRDFWIMKNANECTIAISTFSWSARWLTDSDNITCIPIAGFLDQKNRPDISLTNNLPENFIKIPVKEQNDKILMDWLID